MRRAASGFTNFFACLPPPPLPAYCHDSFKPLWVVSIRKKINAFSYCRCEVPLGRAMDKKRQPSLPLADAYPITFPFLAMKHTAHAA